jgi:porin
VSRIRHILVGFAVRALAAARRLVLSAVVAASIAPIQLFAADATIDRPNQYPSPSVKQPAPDEQFDDDYPWATNTLTGDWGGLRSELAERGIVFDSQYVALPLYNAHGGFDTGFFGAGPLGITSTVDMERLCGCEGGMLFFDWEFNHWLNHRFPPNGQFDPTGSFVGVNTNLIGNDVARMNQIAQLYYEQSWFDDSLCVAFGKMDANVPFASVAPAGPFQNSIAMYTPTLNNYFPTYPNEATAVVTTVKRDNADWKFGLFDGTTAAFDPATGTTGPATGPRGPRTFFDNDGHWLWMTQADWRWTARGTLPGTVGFGAWLHTGRSATAGNPREAVSDVPGCYLQWAQRVWAPSAEIAADGGGVSYFGQVGWSDPNKNAVHWSLMTGFSATGILPTRPADAVGIMYAHSEFSDDPAVYESQFRNGQSGPAGGSERSLESFYIWQTTSWSYVQPGVMWIGSPGGGDPAALNDAFLVYMLFGFKL